MLTTKMKNQFLFKKRYQQKRNNISFSEVQNWSNRLYIPVTMRSMQSGMSVPQENLKPLIFSNFKHRICAQLVRLESLPFGISATKDISSLIKKYIILLTQMQAAFSPDFDLEKFLVNYLQSDADTFELVALGLIEWMKDMKSKYSDQDMFAEFTGDIDDTFSVFFQRRISSRLIAMNYLSIVQKGHSLVDTNVDINMILERAFYDAKILCSNKYGIAPSLDLQGKYDGNFKYITPQLYSIFHELLKNSVESTVLQYNKIGSNTGVLPDVVVRVSNENNNPTIHIHDEGIGVSPENLKYIWSYFYSTSSDSIHHSQASTEYLLNSNLLSGFGFGLPLTKTLVQYFGGDISLNSIKGVDGKHSCTDTYIYFQGNESSRFDGINPEHSY